MSQGRDYRTHYVVHYMSCFNEHEEVELWSKNNAMALVSYLKSHPVARPLYLVTVRYR